MRRTFVKLALLSSLAIPLVGSASTPSPEAGDAAEHRDGAACTCKQAAPHQEGPTAQKPRNDAGPSEPSEFLLQVWTSP